MITIDIITAAAALQGDRGDEHGDGGEDLGNGHR